jgi:hypothetical protein
MPRVAAAPALQGDGVRACLTRTVFCCGTEQVSYHEFKHWWYMHKNGKPKMDRCPSLFLDMLAQRMTTQGGAVVPSMHSHTITPQACY